MNESVVSPEAVAGIYRVKPAFVEAIKRPIDLNPEIWVRYTPETLTCSVGGSAVHEAWLEHGVGVWRNALADFGERKEGLLTSAPTLGGGGRGSLLTSAPTGGVGGHR